MLAKTVNIKDRWNFLQSLVEKAKAGDATARKELKTWETGDAFARYWSLNACFFHRDWKVAAAMMQDPVRKIRLQARALFCRYAPDDELVQTMKAFDRRGHLLFFMVQLKRRKRQNVIDRYFREAGLLDATGANSPLADLSSFATHYNEANWDVQRYALSSTFWSRMAALDSKAVVRLLHDEIHAQTWNYGSASKVSIVLEKLAKVHITAGADLLESIQQSPLVETWIRYLPRSLLHGFWKAYPERLLFPLIMRLQNDELHVLRSALAYFRVDDMAERLPPEVLRWILHHSSSCLSDSGSQAFRWLHRLNAQQKRELWKTFVKFGQPIWGGHLLHIEGVPGAEKEEVYQRWSQANRQRSNTIPVDRLMSLPNPWREREALRHLRAVESLKTKEAERISYASLLPYPEAQTHVLTYWQNPDSDKRALAWSILIQTCELYPEHIHEVFRDILKKRNEQDPVRRRILSGLLTLRKKVLRLIPIADLEQLIGSYLQASDLSAESILMMGYLLNNHYHREPEWATHQWTALLKAHPVACMRALSELCENLQDHQIDSFLQRFGSLLRTWRAIDRYDCIMPLARTAKRHLHRHPEIVKLLEDLIHDGSASYQCNAVLALLLRYLPKRFEALVLDVVKKDTSILLLPVVEQWVSRQRQEFLDRILDPEPLQGRWSITSKKVIPQFKGSVHLWTPTQQASYEKLLVQLLHVDRPVDEARLYFALVPQLCFLPHASLKATLSDPRPLMRELAIRALGRTADTTVLPILLEQLEGDGARFAIYSLRKLVVEASAADVVKLMEQVPFKGITVAKEVCRLLGEYGGAGAVPLLLKRGREAQHQDIFIAVVRSLWNYPHLDEVWDFLFEAAENGRPQVVSRLAAMPQLSSAPDVDRKFAQLMSLLLNRPEPYVHLEVLNQLHASPIEDGGRLLLRLYLDKLSTASLDESRSALSLAISRMRSGEEDIVAQAIVRGCSNPQRTQALLAGLIAQVRSLPHDLTIKLGQRVLAALRDDPIHTPAIVELAHVSRMEPAFWHELADRKLLDADCLPALTTWLLSLKNPLEKEQSLRKSSDPILRKLGLVALRWEVSRVGWLSQCRKWLAAYQADPSNFVRREAMLIFPENQE